MPAPHPIADPQGLDGAFAAIGHQDAGTGNEAGLGMGLVYLPLVVVEVIAQRVANRARAMAEPSSSRRWLGLNEGSDMGNSLVGVGSRLRV